MNTNIAASTLVPGDAVHLDADDDSVVVCDVRDGIASYLPRLRRLLSDKRLSLRWTCLYLGLHPNMGKRLRDPDWLPRLDTLLMIERLLQYEDKPLPVGAHLLDYDREAEMWFVRGMEGLFYDPEAALELVIST